MQRAFIRISPQAVIDRPYICMMQNLRKFKGPLYVLQQTVWNAFARKYHRPAEISAGLNFYV